MGALEYLKKNNPKAYKEQTKSSSNKKGGGAKEYLKKNNPTAYKQAVSGIENSSISDPDDVLKWWESASDFMKDATEFYKGNSNKYSFKDKHKDYDYKIKSTLESGQSVLDYLDQNKDSLVNYDDMRKSVESVLDVFGNFDTAYSDVNDFYSQFETEEDYNAYKDAVRQQTKTQNLNIDKAETEVRALEQQLKTVRDRADKAVENGTMSIDEASKGIKDLEAALGEKKREINLAKRYNRSQELSSVTSASDFDKYSQIGAEIKNPTYNEANFGLGFFDDRPFNKDPENIVTFSRENVDMLNMAEKSGTVGIQGKSLYQHMTDDEVAIYNYYLGKGDKETADEYLESLTDTLNYKAATAEYERLYKDNTAMEYLFSVEAGLDQFFSGMKANFTDADYIHQSKAQHMSGMIREDLADVGGELPEWMGGGSVGQMFYDMGTSTANMLPSILVSMVPVVGQFAGPALMGMSSGGNAYAEMINLGYDKDQARMYAGLVGGSEAGLQYVLGGISALGGKVSGNIIAKFVNKVDNALARTAIKLGGSMGSEFTEEYLQEILTPVYRNIAFNEQNEVELFSEEALYAGLLGAMTSSFLEGGGTISGEVNNYTTGKALDKAGIKYTDLTSLAGTYSADSVAYQLAGRVDENTGAYTIGRLFNEMGATLTEQNVADITENLKSQGVDARSANILASALVDVVNGSMSLTEAQAAALEANDTLSRAVVETVINPNSTEYQRTSNYYDMLDTLAREMTAESSATTASEETAGQTEKAITEENTASEDIGLDEALVAETIASMNVNPSAANILMENFKSPANKLSAEVYAKGIEEAYRYGSLSIPVSDMMRNGAFSKDLSRHQRTQAYNLGEQATQAKVAKLQAQIDSIAGKGIKKANINGKVHFDRANRKFNAQQESALAVMDVISAATGTDIYVFESYELNGERVYKNKAGEIVAAPNGFYDPKDGSIHLDLNAGATGRGTMLFTAAHEFTHKIKDSSPAKYKLLADTLMKAYASRGVSVDALVQRQISKAKKAKRNLTYEEAYDEVIADSMESILQSGNVLETLAEIKKQDKSLWQAIVNFFKDFAAKIRKAVAAYKGFTPDSIEGRMIAEMKDFASELEQIYADALADVGKATIELELGQDEEISNEESFLDSEQAIKCQIRPPYNDGNKAFNEFVDGLNSEARKTFDLFYGFYQKSRITNALSVSGKTVKKVNISSLYLRAQQWNDMLSKDEKWATAAKELAEFLPADIRERMGMHEDGSLSPTPLEEEFKMPSSLAQRLVDSLPFEAIEGEYQLDGKTITLPKGKARQSVGGEAYRRAILNETRKLFAQNKLRKVGIKTMSKDRWGSLGFLAANNKTEASGDFTTICPQMMFNRGCWYCYRRAALESGVNNKLVAQNVWYTGEILRIKDSDIEALNKNGGLRIQSFGDWMPHFSAMLADVLYDAEQRGLQVKIITKEPSMINYIAALREQGVGKNLYFNLSADYTIEKAPQKRATDSNSLDAINPERPFMRDEDNTLWWKRAMTVEEAARYREKYDWVNTRIVATDVDEFIRGLKDPKVDVVTGYHGNIREYERVDSTVGEHKLNVEALGDAGMPSFTYNPVTNTWLTENEGKTQTHKKLAQAIADEGLQAEYYTKTCCITGRCADCNGKCGALARDFNVKNATNRDAESVAYWQKHMQYGIEPEFDTVENEDNNKFSLLNDVEETKDLIAMHNITPQLLTDALRRNGLIMPSIAVTNKGLTDFGDISLVFDKKTIDPNETQQNKLFGSDAWTPAQMNLKMNAKFDQSKTSSIVSNLKSNLESMSADSLFSDTAEEFERKISRAKGSVYTAYAHDVGMQAAYAIENGLIDNVPLTKDGAVDKVKLQEELDKKLDTDAEWRVYKRWLASMSDEVITQYSPATNRDIMKNMKSQPKTAKPFRISETGELTVPSVEYSSIDEARSNKHRLSEDPSAEIKKVSDSLINYAKKISNSSGASFSNVIKAINSSFDSRYDVGGISDSFNAQGINISQRAASELQNLYKDAVELPTPYFESKPGRYVGFSEVKAAIIPDTQSAELSNLKAELESRGISIMEYKAGSKESRLEALNSQEHLKFSDRDSEGHALTQQQQEFFKDSKVRDENGNLKVVYHGTPSGGFTQFQMTEHAHSSLMSEFGAGFYFDTNKDGARRYMKPVNKTSRGGRAKLYEAYLNIKNPLEISDRSHVITKEQLTAIVKQGNYEWFFTNGMPHELQNWLKKSKSEIQKLPREEIIDAWVDMTTSRADSDSDMLSQMVKAFKGDHVVQVMKNVFGKDGVRYDYEYGEYWIAWDANQIKSTANTSPTSDPDIRYSDRDDVNEEAIRSENEIYRIRNEIAELEESLDFVSEFERKSATNKILKLENQLDKLLSEERKATKRTPLSEIVKNLSNYRYSDLESIAAQLTNSAWDYEEGISRKELEDGIRDIIEERSQEMSPLEMQVPKYGVWVRAPLYQLEDNNENNDIRYSLREGEENAIYIKDGHTKDGKVVDFANAILDGVKKGETRTHKSLTRKWVGIAKDGYVIGRVKLGDPIELRKGTQEYADSLIEGTEYDIKDGQTRYYYPVEEVMDFRNNPRPVLRNGSMYGQYQLEDNKKNNDIKHSVREITGDSGKNYGWGVYLDSNLLTGLSMDERKEMVKLYVSGDLAGQHFIAYDRNANPVDVQIAKKEARFTNAKGKKKQVISELYRKNNNIPVKQEAVVLADELIATASYKKQTPAKHSHGWLDNKGKNDWDEWTVFMQEKNNTVWSATLFIANTTGGDKILYDIDSIKKEEGAGKSATQPLNTSYANSGAMSSTSSNKQTQVRETNSVSNRSLLANAFEGIAQNEIEQKKIAQYKSQVERLDAENQKLNEINKQIKELSFGKTKKIAVSDVEALVKSGEKNIHGYEITHVYKGVPDVALPSYTIDTPYGSQLDHFASWGSNLDNEIAKSIVEDYNKRVAPYKRTQDIKQLRDEATKTANRINNLDKKLLGLEASKPLQAVLKREKQKAYKRAAEKGKQALEDYRMQADERIQKVYERVAEKNAKLREQANERILKAKQSLMAKHAESRKNAIERRNRKETRRKIQKVVKDLRQFLLRPDKKKHVPINMQKAVAEALDIVNMDTVGAEERIAKYDALIAKTEDPEVLASLTETRDRIASQGSKMAEKLERLHSAYEEFIESDDPDIANAYDEVISNLINSTAKEIGETSIKDMSLEQLESVYDMYKAVLTRVRDSNRTFADTIKERINDIAGNVFGELSQLKDKKRVTSKIGKDIAQFSWNNTKPVYAFERIGSPTLSRLYKNIRKGEDTWAVDIEEAKAFSNSVKEKYGYKKWDMYKEYEFESATGKKFTLNLEEMMSIYAEAKREADIGTQHLRKGGFIYDDNAKSRTKKVFGLKTKVIPEDATFHKLNDQLIQDIISTMDSIPGVRGFVDEMQGYLSTDMGAKGNEVSMAMYGIKLYKEKNYFPLHVSSDYNARIEAKQKGEVKIKNAGFTKEINTKASAPIVLTPFMDVWAEHVNDMAMYHSFVLPLEDFYRVYNSNSGTSDQFEAESIKQQIKAKHGAAATGYIEQLLKDVNGDVRSDPRESTFKGFVSGFKKAAVMASLSVVIQQPSSFARALSMIDARDFMYKPSKLSPNKLWEEVKKYAPIAIIKEMGKFDTDVGQSTVDYLKDQRDASTVIDKALGTAPAVADQITWNHIWMAVKHEIARKNKDIEVGSEEFFKKAGERFTEVITKTQVYDSVFSRSANMRSKNAFMQMLTAFMAEPTTTLNMYQDAIRQGKMGYKKAAARTIASIYASIALNSALSSIVYAMRDDDEDETWIEKYLQSFSREMADGINPLTYYPGIKDAWSIMQGFSVERADMSMIQDLWTAVETFSAEAAKDTAEMDEAQLTEHDEAMITAAHDLASAMSALFGVPVGNIIREVKAGINTYEVANSGLGEDATLLWDKVLDSLKSSVPIWGKEKTDSKDKLYETIVRGDKTYVDRIKATYKDEEAYEKALRTALRENDPRIKEAAEAKYSGDIARYKNLFKEIKGEGAFGEKTILAAIDSEFNKLKPEEESSTADKESSIFNIESAVQAAINGDRSTAIEAKEDIIRVAMANGKSKDQATTSFNNSFNSNVKDKFDDGVLNATEAKRMLETVGGKTAEEALDKVRYWEVAKRYPNADISEEAVAGFYKPIEDLGYSMEDAGISMAAYVNYKTAAKTCKGVDSDGDGKTDNGSKKAEILLVIDALDLTPDQKDALYFDNGWAASKLHEAPWR